MLAADQRLYIKFWGTRGSLPSPGNQTIVFGGNTSCTEVRTKDHLLILDAGSGMRILGKELLKEMPLKAHILFSHYHWDHIMGLPFFAPLFIDGNEINLYGESKKSRDVKEILSGQMTQPYFPVTMGIECKSTIKSHPVKPGVSFSIGDIQVSTCRLYHPGGAIAYRLDYKGLSLVYATDIEHNSNCDKSLLQLTANADILVYDATYTEEEFGKHLGWGHSTWNAGVELAKKAKVKQFVIFHHMPERDDDSVAELERMAKRAFANSIAAKEGMVLSL